MVQKTSDTVTFFEDVPQFKGFSKEDPTTEFLAINPCGGFLTIMDCATKAKINEPVAPKTPFPSQPHIGLTGITGRVH